MPIVTASPDRSLEARAERHNIEGMNLLDRAYDKSVERQGKAEKIYKRRSEHQKQLDLLLAATTCTPPDPHSEQSAKNLIKNWVQILDSLPGEKSEEIQTLLEELRSQVSLHESL